MKLILFVVGVGLLVVGFKAYPLLLTLPGPLTVLAVVPKQGYMGLGGLLALVPALWSLLGFFRKRPTQKWSTQRQFVPVESSDEDEQGEEKPPRQMVRPPRQTVPVRREKQRSTAKKGGFFGLSWFAVAGIVLVTALVLITLLQFGTGGTAVVPAQVQSQTANVEEQKIKTVIPITEKRVILNVGAVKYTGPDPNNLAVFLTEVTKLGEVSQEEINMALAQGGFPVTKEYPNQNAIEVYIPSCEQNCAEGPAIVLAPFGYPFEPVQTVAEATAITQKTPQPTPLPAPSPEKEETNPLIYFFIVVGVLLVVIVGTAVFLGIRGFWIAQIPRGQQAYIENRFNGTARFETAGTKPYVPFIERVSLFPSATVDIAIPSYSVDFKATAELERLADEGQIDLGVEGLVDGSFDITLRVVIEDVGKLVQVIEDATDTWRDTVKGIARGIAYETARRYTFLEFDRILADMRQELRETLQKYGIGLDLLRLENANVAEEYRIALQQRAVQQLTAQADREYMDRTQMKPEVFVQKVAAEHGMAGQFTLWLQQLLAGRASLQPAKIEEVADEQSDTE